MACCSLSEQRRLSQSFNPDPQHGPSEGIVTLKSKDLKTWERGGSVFAQTPAWVQQTEPNFKGEIWAPDISFYKGQYHLFYAVSNSTGKNDAAIGPRHQRNPG